MKALRRALVVSCSILALGPMSLLAQATEYFSQPDFAINAPGLTLVNFDSQSPGNGQLDGFEYVALGLTIFQVNGGPINVAQNLVSGGWGGNFLTEANINSAPNAISASIGEVSFLGGSDNFDFVFDPLVSAAGLFVGNLGNCGNAPTTVQFLDDFDQVIAEEQLEQTHAGVIFGTAADTVCGGMSPVPFDSRIFYGVISAAPDIRTIRVLNGANDGDGINFDDVQFAVAIDYLSCLGFEPPMATGPVTVRGNRALPLKAQLFDSDNNLVTNLDIGAPPVLQVWYEYGTPDADDVTGEALPSGQSSEGNQFFFDSDQRWHYNLKTKNYSAPGTYTVFMDSGDASEYAVNPTCTAQFVVK